MAEAAGTQGLGIFEGSQDIGRPAKPGRVSERNGVYEVSGGGQNMWFTNDAFYFVWKRVSGDFDLQAAVQWIGAGGDPHRKACLLVRQNLEPGSAYVDVALHGDGLTSLQYRESEGGLTREIQTGATRPMRLGIARQGEKFLVSTGQTERELKLSGAFMRLKLQDPVYVGLGVCAHDDKALETARFSQVQLQQRKVESTNTVLHCALETIAIASRDRRVVYHTTNHIEAPNWSRDGSYLLFNSGGRMFRLPVAGGEPVRIDTGFAERCNNDHGLSPDGSQLVISDQTREGKSLIYLLPVTGGNPRQVTSLGPSYWHGWSPDGKTLAYCAERGGEYDVYTIATEGGAERRLTEAKGLDDGPDYTADGQWIYFNSDRTGTMQIWRMHPDGSGQEQVTRDEFNNWFPHPSPDGKWLVFLSYEKDVSGHPANKPVWLRLMPLAGGPVQELARLFGGQGTINVPSWSPDCRQVAFVSYELIRPD
ncbi:MAG TPA: hypothetical protein VN673_16725 [Clostridia bacterium]|nr:hypothetical protein [Clostridia bacterium]